MDITIIEGALFIFWIVTFSLTISLMAEIVKLWEKVSKLEDKIKERDVD